MTPEEEKLKDEAPEHYLPWRKDYDENDNPIVVAACFSDETPVMAVGTKAWPMLEEDADFIVEACNNYQALQSENARLREEVQDLRHANRRLSDQLRKHDKAALSKPESGV